MRPRPHPSSPRPARALAAVDRRLPAWLSLLLAVSLLTLLAPGCATNPATGKRQLSLIGEQQEIAMGREADQQIVAQLGLYPDEGLQRYVDGIGQAMAAESERPDLPWTFRVVDDPIVNAFALPGGFIYVTRGILGHMDTEAELAAVLGHEIGHVTGRHGVEQMSKAQLAGLGLGVGAILEPEVARFADLAQTGLGLLFLKYGRDAEREADSLGLRYLVRDGYDARQMPEVFAMLGRVSAAAGAGRIPGWLSTHPAPENREQLIAREISEQQIAPGGKVESGALLAQIDGVVFGDDPRQGFFEGSTFYHPELAFRIDFPDGWQLANQRQAVTAASPQQDAAFVLTLVNAASPDAAARQFFGQQGLRQGNRFAGGFGGLPSVASYFAVDRGQQEDLQGVAAFVGYGDNVYRLLGYTAASDFRGYRPALQQAAASFARLRDRSKLDVQPRRIEVVRLDRDMTIEEFARRYPSTVDVATLALINQVDAGERLAAGQRAKRVVGGP